jgi:alcohol dehydrogenase (cytochrome c)
MTVRHLASTVRRCRVVRGRRGEWLADRPRPGLKGSAMKRLIAPLVLVTAAAAWTLHGAAQETTRPFKPVSDEMLQKPDPADWLMWRRTLDSQGYSPLNQINRDNVARLRMTWSHGMGPGGVQEATPLVYDGMMFVPNPGDYIQALDARTGDLVWEHKRALPQGVRAGTNRNIAIWGSTIIDGSSDNQMYAIDARTGKLVWETAVLDARAPASPSSGPIIA